MDKQREIEQFRQNVLPQYLKLAEELQKINEPPRCIQCGRVKPKEEFYLYNINGVSLCRDCAVRNYNQLKKDSRIS